MTAVAELHLIVEKGPREGETLRCYPRCPPTKIGRVARGNRFVIKDAGVSQNHLLLHFDSDSSRWTLTDLASSNGTLVNETDIPPSVPLPLSDGDRIKIGEETAISVRIVALDLPVAAVSIPCRARLRTKKDQPTPVPAPSMPRTRAASKMALAVAPLKEVESPEPAISLKTLRTNARRGMARGRGRGGTRVLEQVKIDEKKGDTITGVASDASSLATAIRNQGNNEIGQDGMDSGVDDMEKLTLGEWFNRMEKYLPSVINELSDDLILQLKQQTVQFNEFVSSKSSAG